MSSQHKPRMSVIWNPHMRRYDWSATRSDGATIIGYAATERDAWHEMRTDWRVRGEQPRFVGRRLPRGGIEPPAPA